MKTVIIFMFLLAASFAIKIPTLPLLNGREMPVLGLGTWLATGDDVYSAVKEALNAGYTHIDTADDYYNHKDIGRALKEVFAAGQIKREDIFITSKVSDTLMTREGTHKMVREGLRDLGVDYIDLVLLHWPISKELNIESYQALEEEIENKTIRAAGLSNFDEAHAEEIWKIAKHKPVNIQNQSNPRNRAEGVIEWCKARNVTFTAYSPLRNMLKHKTVVEVAGHYQKSAAQVLIKYQLQRGVITIPKSTHANRIKENLNVFDFTISDDDMNKLNHI